MGFKYTDRAFKNTQVGGLAKLVLLYICEHANEKNDSRAWPGVRKLAKEAKISRGAVLSAIEKLEDLKIITVQRTKLKGESGKEYNAHNVYRLTDEFMGVVRQTATPPKPEVGGGLPDGHPSTPDGHGGPQDGHGGLPRGPKPVSEPVLEPATENVSEPYTKEGKKEGRKASFASLTTLSTPGVPDDYQPDKEPTERQKRLTGEMWNLWKEKTSCWFLAQEDDAGVTIMDDNTTAMRMLRYWGEEEVWDMLVATWQCPKTAKITWKDFGFWANNFELTRRTITAWRNKLNAQIETQVRSCPNCQAYGTCPKHVNSEYSGPKVNPLPEYCTMGLDEMGNPVPVLKKNAAGQTFCGDYECGKCDVCKAEPKGMAFSAEEV